MTLDWQIIIGLVTLALVIFTIVWGTGLWKHRERVKIRITTLDYSIDSVGRKITVYLGYELQRSGGKEIRYTTQILLEPDKQTYSKLCEYFKLPEDGLIRINERLKLQRDNIVSPYMGGATPSKLVYPALPGIQDAKQRDIAQQIASQLSQRVHKVGVVWEDDGKTTWKTISKEDHGKWM
jgi:hypothetical protein